MLGQQLQHRPVQPDPPDLGPQRSVQVRSGEAAPVVATPFSGIAAERMPECAEAIQV